MNKSELKKEAIRRMNKIIGDSYIIDNFRLNDTVYISEYLCPEIPALTYPVKEGLVKDVIKEFEAKYEDTMVYFCQLLETKFGPLLSLFYVDSEVEAWFLEEENLEANRSLCYVVNSYDIENELSEFGSIGFKRVDGSITRIF